MFKHYLDVCFYSSCVSVQRYQWNMINLSFLSIHGQIRIAVDPKLNLEFGLKQCNNKEILCNMEIFSQQSLSSNSRYRFCKNLYFATLCQVTIGILGLLGNISLICWFAKKTRNFHHLMLVLSFYDTIYILANVSIFGLPNIFSR